MGKKNKKSGKKEGNLLQNAARQSVEQLLDDARGWLQRGKAREAIDVLKQAGKLDKNAEGINVLLYRAYSLREEQLRSKGMTAEADVVKKIAFSIMPGIEILTDAELSEYIGKASIREFLPACMKFFNDHPAPEWLYRRIAYRLMVSPDWDAIASLDASHPLKQHARAAQEAVSLMNNGKWEDAAQSLKSVPRISPYMPMRLFCRAMAQFYEEEDKEMLQTLSRIPDDFPLQGVIENLKRYASGANIGQNPFCNDSIHLETLVDTILKIIRSRKLNQLPMSVRTLANAVFPADPNFAIWYILDVIIPEVLRSNIYIEDYLELISVLLPDRLAGIMKKKMEFILGNHYLFMDGIKYLVALEKEISDPVQRNIVLGMVMVKIAQELKKDKPLVQSQLLKTLIQQSKAIECLRDISNPEMIAVKLVASACELDPLNRGAYECLVKLPRTSKDIWKIVEAVLLKMSEMLPEDPFPCLELAPIYYEKNAFRKAENILAEASRRAPHDNRVIDRHALSLLVSAWKNFQRKKYHLMEADFLKAGQFNSKKVAPFLLEKQLLYDLVTSHDVSAVLKNERLLQYPAIEQMRILAMLYGDIEAMPKGTFPADIITQLGAYIKKQLRALPLNKSADIAVLLSPLPEEFRLILPSINIALILLEKQPAIFSHIPDAELVNTFLLIFQRDILEIMAKELRQRLRKILQSYRYPIRFFLVAIEQIASSSYNTAPFNDIIEKASDEMMHSLKNISQKLSRYAFGDLKKALEFFNFPEDSGGFLFDDDEFDDDEFDDDEFDDIAGEVPAGIIKKMILSNMTAKEKQEMIASIELLIDKLDLRGASKGEILSARMEIMSVPQTKSMLFLIGVMGDSLGEKLSREAKILISK